MKRTDDHLTYDQRRIVELEDRVGWYRETGLQIAVILIIVAFSIGVFAGMVIK